MAAELGKGWGATCQGGVRGALDALKPEDPLNLSSLEVTADYAHSLDVGQTGGGAVGVAIQAITVNLTYTRDQRETSTGNLHISAQYVRKEPVPALPVSEAPAGG
jgi:hypothetical protein